MQKIKYGCLAILAFSAFNANSQIVTFTRASNGTNAISIPAGEAWQIHSWFAPGGDSSHDVFTCYLGGNVDYGTTASGLVLRGTGGAYYSIDNPNGAGSSGVPLGIVVTGPASFKIASRGLDTNYTYLLAFKKINSAGGSNSISATSVVIPQAATGDVDIKLEQSADNVTWTECLPGTYNSSTVKRFFRLRAVEK